MFEKHTNQIGHHSGMKDLILVMSLNLDNGKWWWNIDDVDIGFTQLHSDTWRLATSPTQITIEKSYWGKFGEK